MRAASLSLVCLLLVPVAGCGGGDEDVRSTQTTTTRTEETVPDRTAPAETAPAPATPAPAVPPPPDGGHDRETGGAPAPTPTPTPDTPENDRPPPPGSPAERFERECEEKPELCG